MSKLKDEIDKFNSVAKLMLKTDISKNIETLKNYRRQIIKAYNKFTDFVKQNYNLAKKNEQEIIDNKGNQNKIYTVFEQFKVHVSIARRLFRKCFGRKCQ